MKSKMLLIAVAVASLAGGAVGADPNATAEAAVDRFEAAIAYAVDADDADTVMVGTVYQADETAARSGGVDQTTSGWVASLVVSTPDRFVVLEPQLTSITVDLTGAVRSWSFRGEGLCPGQPYSGSFSFEPTGAPPTVDVGSEHDLQFSGLEDVWMDAFAEVGYIVIGRPSIPVGSVDGGCMTLTPGTPLEWNGPVTLWNAAAVAYGEA